MAKVTIPKQVDEYLPYLVYIGLLIPSWGILSMNLDGYTLGFVLALIGILIKLGIQFKLLK